jgi:15-cis-phytoene desaturase
VSKTVVIVGGGVAGLSAAQELLRCAERGLDVVVQVLERGDVPGGKARSIDVPSPQKVANALHTLPVPKSRPLPGEHGFRFFPGFYRHLPDTLSNIPARDPGTGSSPRTVWDELVIAPRLGLVRDKQPPLVVGTRLPETLQDWTLFIQDAFANVGVSRVDVAFFASRVWQVMSSCSARSLAEYEPITWWSFIDADRRSVAYRDLLAEGLSRSLLANDPRTASARTVGTTNGRLLQALFGSTSGVDHVLNGPTSDVWLEPWLSHLKRNARFTFRDNTVVKRIVASGDTVASVMVDGENGQQTVPGDYFIFCVPVERMAELISASDHDRTADLLRVDPSLGGILKLAESVAWMNGIQFFLYRPVPVVAGHCLYVDSPWSLTSISEGQFWTEVDLPNRGDGTVRDILSVCISNWNANGILYCKPARELTHEQIANEVWEQLKASLNVDGAVVLRDEDRHSWFLDPDIVRDDPRVRTDPDRYNDMEPLFVNGSGAWNLRPKARTGIRNLFLAADYVQTTTDVACMEAANEAARLAVNALLEASRSSAPPCTLFELDRPVPILKALRKLDEVAFSAGLPWGLGFPPAFKPSDVSRARDAVSADPRRPSRAPSSLPRYYERSGEQTTAAPYECKNTTLHGFIVEGNALAIQTSIVDPCLNDCTEDAFGFRVAGSRILVTFTTAEKLHSLVSPDRQKGFTPEKACVVWIPVLSTRGESKLYAFPSYILVDNPWSVATGREVHGFPKELGEFRIPADGDPPTLFGVSTMVLPQFGADRSTEWKTILEVRQRSEGEVQPWSDFADALSHVFSHWFGEGRSDALPPLDLARGVLDAVKAHGVPMLFLKQFRDAEDGTRACFQSLVAATSRVTGFRRAGLQAGRFDLTAATFASHPLGRDLGLAADRVPVGVSFFIDLDFELSAGTEIWRASSTH